MVSKMRLDEQLGGGGGGGAIPLTINPTFIVNLPDDKPALNTKLIGAFLPPSEPVNSDGGESGDAPEPPPRMEPPKDPQEDGDGGEGGGKGQSGESGDRSTDDPTADDDSSEGEGGGGDEEEEGESEAGGGGGEGETGDDLEDNDGPQPQDGGGPTGGKQPEDGSEPGSGDEERPEDEWLPPSEGGAQAEGEPEEGEEGEEVGDEEGPVDSEPLDPTVGKDPLQDPAQDAPEDGEDGEKQGEDPGDSEEDPEDGFDGEDTHGDSSSDLPPEEDEEQWEPGSEFGEPTETGGMSLPDDLQDIADEALDRLIGLNAQVESLSLLREQIGRSDIEGMIKRVASERGRDLSQDELTSVASWVEGELSRSGPDIEEPPIERPPIDEPPPIEEPPPPTEEEDDEWDEAGKEEEKEDGSLFDDMVDEAAKDEEEARRNEESDRDQAEDQQADQGDPTEPDPEIDNRLDDMVEEAVRKLQEQGLSQEEIIDKLKQDLPIDIDKDDPETTKRLFPKMGGLGMDMSSWEDRVWQLMKNALGIREEWLSIAPSRRIYGQLGRDVERPSYRAITIMLDCSGSMGPEIFKPALRVIGNFLTHFEHLLMNTDIYACKWSSPGVFVYKNILGGGAGAYESFKAMKDIGGGTAFAPNVLRSLTLCSQPDLYIVLSDMEMTDGKGSEEARKAKGRLSSILDRLVWVTPGMPDSDGIYWLQYYDYAWRDRWEKFPRKG